MANMQMDGSDVISRQAGANLAGKLFYFVNQDTSGNIVLATAAAAALGSLVEENTVTTSPYSPVSVQHSGISKVIAGGTIAAGAQVEVGSGGTAVTLSSGVAVGQYIGSKAAAQNDIIEVKLY